MRAHWAALLLFCGYASCIVPPLAVRESSDPGGSGPASSGSSPGGRGGIDGAAGEQPSGGTTSNGGSATAGAGGKAAPSGGGGSTAQGDAGSGGAVDSSCPKPAGEICHELVVTDNSRHAVTYIDEFTSQAEGGVVWSKIIAGDGNTPRSIELVDNASAKSGKAVLVSVNDGFVEYDSSDGAIIVRITTLFTGVSAACRLPNRNTALGVVDKVRVVASDGAEVSSFVLPNGSVLYGLVREPTTGNFWFSKANVAYEFSPAGVEVWKQTLNAGTTAAGILWRDGGGAFVSNGDGGAVMELDGTAIVGSVGGKATFPFIDYAAGFVRLANGNFVIANWLGHLASPPADSPHVVELTPGNELVWQWGNQTLARQITDVYVIR